MILSGRQSYSYKNAIEGPRHSLLSFTSYLNKVGNVHYSDLLRVPLSTVDQSSSVIGETAAELLAHCMEAKTPPAPKHIFIPARLVVRESSRRRQQVLTK